ncbi:MAG: WD40 repeat domain-containing protein [Pirellulales bacterium]
MEKLLTLRGPSEEAKVLRFAPDNRRLVAGLADGSLVVWRTSP